jgi:hypothetical protein
MSAPSLPVRVGNVGGTPIVADIGAGVRGTCEALVAVTLTDDYVMECPPGYPSRPTVGGATPSNPRTLVNGSTVILLEPEARALIMAGAANYVGDSGINTQSGTTYVLQASDNGKIVDCTSASAVTITVPSGLDVGFDCGVLQRGAGQVTIVPGDGVTLNNRQGFTKTAGQYALVALVSPEADIFVLVGDGA